MKRHVFNAVGNYCKTREFNNNEELYGTTWFSLSDEELNKENYQKELQKIRDVCFKNKRGKQKPFYSFAIDGKLLGLFYGRKDFGSKDSSYKITPAINGEQDLIYGQIVIRVDEFSNKLLLHRLENARYYLQEFVQNVRPLVSVDENGTKIYSCQSAIKAIGLKTPTIYDCLNGSTKTYAGKYWYQYDKYMKGGIYSYDKYSRVQK